MMKMATALIQCMMRSGRGWSWRSLRGVDVTIWLDIDDFPLTGGPATPPEGMRDIAVCFRGFVINGPPDFIPNEVSGVVKGAE
jgi:hypothetical protein